MTYLAERGTHYRSAGRDDTAVYSFNDRSKDEKQMSKKDAKDTRWKSEIAREERKARLESLKSGDGGKQPIKTRSIKGRGYRGYPCTRRRCWTCRLVSRRAGILHRRVTAMTINGEKITPVELNYYMSTLASNYMQLDLFRIKGKSGLPRPRRFRSMQRIAST